MFVHEFQLRVRYGETDQMGYCYYGNYPAFYEQARSDAFRKECCSYAELERQGYMMPVLSMHIDYKKPAHYDDLITIRVTVKKRPSVKMEFFYETFNEQGELLNTGSTTLCFVNKATGRPCQVPPPFQPIIEKYFGNE
ncbi:MAG: acyl-CoA thioesterase [Salinivirgaceae bacterium]|nr:acyl-CoA thioesterase [Salinivirgaceae bacterium]